MCRRVKGQPSLRSRMLIRMIPMPDLQSLFQVIGGGLLGSILGVTGSWLMLSAKAKSEAKSKLVGDVFEDCMRLANAFREAGFTDPYLKKIAEVHGQTVKALYGDRHWKIYQRYFRIHQLALGVGASDPSSYAGYMATWLASLLAAWSNGADPLTGAPGVNPIEQLEAEQKLR